jgi:DNA-binding PadR family transcriptional regulator
MFSRCFRTVADVTQRSRAVSAFDLPAATHRITSHSRDVSGTVFGSSVSSKIPPSRIVAIIDELESRGLVERRPDPSDRRVRTIHVTRRGQTLLDDAFNLVVQNELAISKALTAKERAQLLELLNRIAASLDLPRDVHSALGEGDRRGRSSRAGAGGD